MPGFLPPRVFPDGRTKKIERGGGKTFLQKKILPLPSFFPRWVAEGRGGEKSFLDTTHFWWLARSWLCFGLGPGFGIRRFFSDARWSKSEDQKLIFLLLPLPATHWVTHRFVRWQKNDNFLSAREKELAEKTFFRRPKNIAGGGARGGHFLGGTFSPSLTVCRLEQQK